MDTRAGAASLELLWRVPLAEAQAALAEKQADVLDRAEDRLTMLADQQFSWSEFLYDRYKQKIVHCEDKMLSMACDTEPYQANLSAAKNRAEASVRTAFAEARESIRDCGTIWCVGSNCAADRKLAIAEAAALVDAANAAMRIEEAKEKADDEKIYARRVNAANLGRGFSADARASSLASSQLWQGIAQAAGNAMAGNLQGLGDNLSRIVSPFIPQSSPAIQDDYVKNAGNFRGANGETYNTGDVDGSFANAEQRRLSNYGTGSSGSYTSAESSSDQNFVTGGAGSQAAG
jgi:hypothetical protein